MFKFISTLSLFQVHFYELFVCLFDVINVFVVVVFVVVVFVVCLFFQICIVIFTQQYNLITGIELHTLFFYLYFYLIL